MMAALS
jgi:hypothetical protein